MFEFCLKLSIKTLLFLNRFHALFLCFPCWVWTRIRWLGLKLNILVAFLYKTYSEKVDCRFSKKRTSASKAKKKLWHEYFLGNQVKLFRTTLLQHLQGLILWHIINYVSSVKSLFYHITVFKNTFNRNSISQRTDYNCFETF